MPRAKTSTPAASTSVAAPAATPAAPAKAPRARKAPAASTSTTVADATASASTAAVAPAKAPRSTKAKREFSLVVSSVTAVSGPAFNADGYLSGAVAGSDKKARVYRNFSGHGPLQAAKKAFTQIRKFVNVGTCSYRFKVADSDNKETEYTFSCAPRDLSTEEARKQYTIVKKNKDGKTTEFVDRWEITYVSSNPRKRKDESTPAAPVAAAPAPVVETPAPVAEAPKKGGRKAAAK